ncbi:MAG: hypothetical protein ACI8PQ_002454 [Planctomycetota bacterium]|jgi:hypothetical protein
MPADTAHEQTQEGTWESASAEDDTPMADAGSDLTNAEQAIPLNDAAFLAGVSVQALRQRIKRGTLLGAEVIDNRGQRVAGVQLSSLRVAFPNLDLSGLGAMRSNVLVDEAWDLEADLERGGMAPGGEQDASAPVQRVFEDRQVSEWRVSPWSIGLVVALAAVALAGLMTGAKEARAATRSLENAQERESMLMEQLRNIRSERNEVREELKALQLTIRR